MAQASDSSQDGQQRSAYCDDSTRLHCSLVASTHLHEHPWGGSGDKTSAGAMQSAEMQRDSESERERAALSEHRVISLRPKTRCWCGVACWGVRRVVLVGCSVYHVKYSTDTTRRRRDPCDETRSRSGAYFSHRRSSIARKRAGATCEVKP